MHCGVYGFGTLKRPQASGEGSHAFLKETHNFFELWPVLYYIPRIYIFRHSRFIPRIYHNGRSECRNLSSQLNLYMYFKMRQSIDQTIKVDFLLVFSF